MIVNKEYKKKKLLWRKMIIGFIQFLIFTILITPSLSESINIVSNPGFESGTTQWFFYTNGSGTFLNDVPGPSSPSAGHLTISKEGTNVQLYQKGLVLEPNTLYNMSFKAYSNTGHDLSVTIQKHGPPYIKYGLSNYVINLGTSWKEHTIQFTTSGFSGTVNDARLMFWIAPYDAVGDQYYFDDIALISESATPPPPVKPTITTQPSNQTVDVGQTATFNVIATGTAPLSYQWQKNNTNITGATSPTYSTSTASLSDNGAVFRVIVSNSAGSATSDGATLTVDASTQSNKQLVLIDVTYIHNTTVSQVPLLKPAVDGQKSTPSGKAFSFFNLPSWVPNNLVSPVNYAQGTLYQRLQVMTKPSTKNVTYQICLFQDTITASKHACSAESKLKFTSPGTYYAQQSMPSLYQYNNLVWSRNLLIEMLVVKDANGNPVDDRYGFGGKWSGSPNLGLYYPMKVRYTSIIVPQGGGAPVWP